MTLPESALPSPDAVIARMIWHSAGWEHSGLLEYFDALLASDAGQTVLLDAVETVIREGEPARTIDALFGLREVCDWGVPACREAFRLRMLGSAGFAAILGLVSAPNFGLRDAAACILGKLREPAALPTLSLAFGRALREDSLLLPRLLQEIGGLEGQVPTGRYDVVLESPLYLARWSLLHSDIWPHLGAERQERLCEDAHPLVAAEARFSVEPALTYVGLERRFRRHLREIGASDYTVADLERFVASWSAG